MKELRLALREMVRHPGFTLLVVLTLAFGIGLNTAIYTLARHTILRPLPIPDADRLAVVASTDLERGWAMVMASIPELRDLRQESRLIDELAIFAFHRSVNLEGEGPAERLEAGYVTSAYLPLLGGQPALGRLFSSEEDRGPGGPEVVILSDRLWRSRFGADPEVVGSRILLSGRPHTVIGVMPPEFHDLRNRGLDLWLPLASGASLFGQDMFETRLNRQYLGVVRLKPGVELGQGQAEAEELAAHLAREFPEAQEGRGLRLVPLRDFFYRKLERPLEALMVGASLLLLICCLNIATVLTARERARRGETAVRLALGASRSQLARPLILRSLLLSLLGGGLGILAAALTLDGWIAFGGLRLPEFARVGLDLPMLLISIAASLAVGILFGVLPALWMVRADLRGALATTGHSPLAAGRSARWRAALTVVQVALATILLVGAGLTAKSFYRLVQNDLGFETDDLLSLRLELEGAKYPGDEARARFVEELLQRVEALPGVERADVWSPSMLGQAQWHWKLAPEGQDVTDPRSAVLVQRHQISPGALETAGIPVIRGRGFTAADRAKPPPWPVVIGEGLARSLWPGEDALGKRLYQHGHPAFYTNVVGIVPEVQHRGLLSATEPSAGDVYFSYDQYPSADVALLVGYTGDPAAVARTVRSTLAELDPDLPAFDVSTMAERLDEHQARPRLTATLMGVFALLAIVLTVLGIYGLLAQITLDRSGELALRSVMGAGRRELLRIVLVQGLRPVFLGLALGLLGAYLLTRYLASILFALEPFDPLTIVAVCAIVLVSAVVACYRPARVVSNTDPMVVLRSE